MVDLNNEELKNYILDKLTPIKELINWKYHNFCKNNNGSEEGLYIYSDKQGYHFVCSERGSETMHKVTDSIFEISYWTINSIVCDIARSMDDKKRDEDREVSNIYKD
jgi:hypothetical protein